MRIAIGGVSPLDILIATGHFIGSIDNVNEPLAPI
jgi:hypothetical protein